MSPLAAAATPSATTSGPVDGPPIGALVLGADYRGLGVVRSLGRRGVPVTVLKEPAEPLAAVSRYAARALSWPEGEADRVAFLHRLADAEGLRGWALLPTSDEASALVARHHDELARDFFHTTPSWDVLRWAYDKRLTYELADRLGIACPRTVRLLDADQAETAEITFPAVIKPAVKHSFNRLTAAKAWRVNDADELRSRFAEASELMDARTLLVQELVPGGRDSQFSFAALCLDGQALAWLTARRTRQYPPDFGRASTFVETMECAEIVEPSMRLLRETRFTGLIEVEFKRDARDGLYKLLDMNPRVWGWQSLCGRAGVDFPFLLWLMISGESVPATSARHGVGWLRLTTDTPTAVKELLAGRLPVGEYLRSLRRPRESAIFAWDDPVPALAELPLLLYLLGRRVLLRQGV